MGDGGDGTNCTTRYYSAAGVELWHRNHRMPIHDVAIHTDGNMYEVGEVSGGVSIRKRSSSGAVVWSRNHGATLTSCAIHPTGVVAGGLAGTGGYRVRKWNTDGTLAWSANTTYDVITLDCDEDGITVVNGIQYPELVSSSVAANIAKVAFFAADGSLISETDQWLHGETPVFVYNYNTVVSAVCFTRNEGGVAGTPEDRCYVAYTQTSDLFGTRWYYQPLGNFGIDGIMDGQARQIRRRDIVGAPPNFPDGAVAIATSQGGYYDSYSFHPDFYFLPFSGGTNSVCIDTDCNLIGADFTAFRSPAKAGDYFADPPVPYWNPVADRLYVHGAKINGTAINDSGVFVLGGEVAPV
jgi:hypothetical protein